MTFDALIWIAAIPAALGICLQGCFIWVEHKENYVPAVILKGTASAMFVIIGILGFKYLSGKFMLLQNQYASLKVMLPDNVNAARTDDTIETARLAVRFGRLIAIGLGFGMLGDICLNLRFVFKKAGQKVFLLGIVMFLTGHILYLVALIPMASKLLLCVGIGAVLAAGLLVYIFKTMDVKPAFKAFGIVYLGAVIIMTAVAIGRAAAIGNAGSIIYAIGAVLFTASDIVLIFNTFSSVTKFSLRITNLSLYYIGQLLIAGSLFWQMKGLW